MELLYHMVLLFTFLFTSDDTHECNTKIVFSAGFELSTRFEPIHVCRLLWINLDLPASILSIRGEVFIPTACKIEKVAI